MTDKNSSKQDKAASIAPAPVSGTPVPTAIVSGIARSEAREVPLVEIYEADSNARRHFDQAGINDLAADIVRSALINALSVRKTDRGYELIAGARRYRACKQLGMPTVKVNIFDVDEFQARLIGLQENINRKNLNPYDEAVGILDYFTLLFSETPNWAALTKEHGSPIEATGHLLRRFGLRHPEADAKASFDLGMTGNDALALLNTVFGKRVEMNVATFAKNRLKLLNLHQDIHDALRSGQLEYSSALVLQRVDNDELRSQYIKTTIEDKLTVNQVTDLVNDGVKGGAEKAAPTETDVAIRGVRRNLRYRNRLPQAKQKRVDKLIKDLDGLLAEAKGTK